MTTTVALTGMLPFVVLLAAALAYPLCFWLLRLYRRSVLKGMSAGTSERAGTLPVAKASQESLPAVGVRTLTSASPLELRSLERGAYRQASYGPWQSAAVYLERVVFLCDDTTQQPFLESTLQHLWGQMAPDSPNRGPDSAPVRLFRIREQSEPELRALLQLLLGGKPAEPAV